MTADLRDAVGIDCEVVSRQLSRDASTAVGAQHETQVEPDSFAWGSTIVTAFQSARFVDGGAESIGWATSRNAGRTWRTGLLPRLSTFSSPPGTAERVSDPSVAYDAVHGVWLVASLAVAPGGDGLLVSRSADGVAWRAPVVAAGGDGPDAYDKQWIVCDNWQTSPYRGRCYLSYLDLQTGHLATRISSDGGSTWSEAKHPPRGAQRTMILNGAQPVVRPDGSLVVVFAAFGAFADYETNEIGVIRSTDGGQTFSAPARVAPLFAIEVHGMRAPPFPSVEVDAAGTIYAAWHDCRFQEGCMANDIVLAKSQDGVSWSEPTRVQLPQTEEFIDYFTPGLAVDRTTAGGRARIAIAFHAMPQCNLRTCRRVDVGIVSSSDGGLTWGRPDRLTTESMSLWWIADGGLGRMLADYISASFVGGRAVAVFALAAPLTRDERFRQAIFALTTRR